MRGLTWRDRQARRIAQGRKARKLTATSRPAACQHCGRSPSRLTRHHPDYTEPLIVEWLCQRCHTKADALRRIYEHGEKPLALDPVDHCAVIPIARLSDPAFLNEFLNI